MSFQGALESNSTVPDMEGIFLISNDLIRTNDAIDLSYHCVGIIGLAWSPPVAHSLNSYPSNIWINLYQSIGENQVIIWIEVSADSDTLYLSGAAISGSLWFGV
jgi:hypothetical protein